MEPSTNPPAYDMNEHSIHSKIDNSRKQNDALLATLSQTDYAPPALRRQLDYINELEEHLYKVKKDLPWLELETKRELKDHKKYQDSTIRRFAHRLGGSKGKDKWTEKADKEEREFVEAWQKERETRDRKADLEQRLSEAKNAKSSLEGEAKRHDQAQKELDALYESIFQGPTPEFPGEDLREQEVLRAHTAFEEVQGRLFTEKQALLCLIDAQQTLENAQRTMMEALDASTWDMWGGGTFADMMERNALSKAQSLINQLQHQMMEARRVQPAIRDLGPMEIDHGHLMGDVIFDNIFSDAAQHDRIKQSDRQLKQAGERLKEERAAARQRVIRAQQEQDLVGSSLSRARDELQRFRAEAFRNRASL